MAQIKIRLVVLMRIAVLQAFQINCIAPLKMVEAFSHQLEMSQNKLVACISSKMGSMEDNGYGSSYIYRSSKAALNASSKKFID